jgi:hypothetical protein
MTYDSEHDPGTPAPVTGQYEELNVLGAPTGVVIDAQQGVPLPSLPRGFTWRLTSRQGVADMSVAELLAKAAEYRRMAATASTVEVRDALFRLAERFETIAQERSGRAFP